jgi:2-dehydro-3-deoxyphosphogluconate aldolase/(4S)-4-hydroxy-2-oxoglutarate aldolase
MNPGLFPAELLERTRRTGVIAVLVLDDAETTVPLAQALLAGGVDCVELTLRTPAALECVRRIRAGVPQMIVGVGTILTPEQVKDSAAAGAAFGVAPGLNPRTVQAAQAVGLPFAPGICTPTDIEHALELGCRLLKFFPSELCGGLAYLRSIAAPFAHLGVRYVPLGGVSAANAETYMREPLIHALGGSWLAPREAIQKCDWATITKNAREATDIVKRVRAGGAK